MYTPTRPRSPSRVSRSPRLRRRRRVDAFILLLLLLSDTYFLLYFFFLILLFVRLTPCLPFNQTSETVQRAPTPRSVLFSRRAACRQTKRTNS